MKFAFWFAAALLTWTYLLFPLAMLVCGRLFGRTPSVRTTGTFRPEVTIVLAARNAAEILEARVKNLLAQAYPSERLRVLIVCNGCTDTSIDVARAIAAREPRVAVRVSSSDEGKAGAINLGVVEASGEIIVFADCRQTFAPDAVCRLVEGFEDPTVGAVSGRLVIGEANSAAVKGVGIYWKLETQLRRAQGSTGSVMGATGAIYAIRRELFTAIPPNLILDDVYVPMQVVLRRSRVVLCPQAVAFDSASRDAVLEYRRKLRTMTGNIELLRVMPELLSPRRNPFFFRYVSHKVLRIASPLLLLTLIASGIMLPLVPYFLVSSLALAAIIAGLLGLIVPHAALAVPTGFLLVQVAATMAILRPRGDARTLWASDAATADVVGRAVERSIV